MANRTPRKPSGKSGLVKLSTDAAPEWDDFALPPDKKYAEEVVAKLFVKCLPRGEQAVIGIIDKKPENVLHQLDEDDHDFILKGLHQEWLLQLTEFIPVPKFKGNYEKAPNRFVSGAVSDMLLEQIEKKSSRYSREKTRKLVLVIFISDQKFWVPDINVSVLMRHELRKISHCFNRIYVMPMMGEESAFPELIYPGPPLILTDMQIHELRKEVYQSFTFSDMRPVSHGGVEIDLNADDEVALNCKFP